MCWSNSTNFKKFAPNQNPEKKIASTAKKSIAFAGKDFFQRMKAFAVINEGTKIAPLSLLKAIAPITAINDMSSIKATDFFSANFKVRIAAAMTKTIVALSGYAVLVNLVI